MKIYYFAWVRERTGRSDETVTLPEGVTTVAELIDWLKTRGPEFEFAFENERFVRAAVDQQLVSHDTSLKDVNEVAFFPPMTGG